MNSSSELNYEIRPCKFAERKMLLASFSRIISHVGKPYQYIGFGGLSFTDFKLFHKELNIDTLYSIEGGEYSQAKILCNRPYSYIQILKGMSTEILPYIDLSIPSIIWLDYDDVMSMTFFHDIDIIFDSISIGSIFIITCNRQLRNPEKNQPCSPEDLRNEYGDLAPYYLESDCCTDMKAAITIKSMIENKCKLVINERNSREHKKLQFQPLYNIKYSEHRGARMYTYGGIVLDENMSLESLNVNTFDFIGTQEPYEIIVPNITRREAMCLNQVLGDAEAERELINKGIVYPDQIENYKKFYKYMPNLYDVRL